MNMDVVIGISMRETVSVTINSLKSVLEYTPDNVPIIFVASGMPADVIEEIEEISAKRPMEIIYRDTFLSPNQARNLILERATNKYIAFVDNDVIVSENWLEAMVQCAEEEDAAIVTPLIFERYPMWRFIHMAGGEAEVLLGDDGTRICHEKHAFIKHDLVNSPTDFERQPTELFEFHTVLINREFLLELGRLDEQLLSVSEHWDVCIAAKEMNRKIFLEPASRINYVPPARPTDYDIRFFNLRWCDDWVDTSINRLVEKYDLSPRHGNLIAVKGFVKGHRLHKYVKLRKFIAKIFGPKGASVFLNRVVTRIDPLVVNRAIKDDFRNWQAYTRKQNQSA
ncbi:MAG: glycosyltransferase family 2 protein [Sneathiella sp.]|nr:glycosyltransferase family 2 protein [Sneathiella sp.]